MTEQGSSSSSSSSSCSFSYKWTYNVFLSFRGKDTRKGFTGNLYKALCQRGICTFMDDPELKKGEGITPGLKKAIERSRIAIVVFSDNFASSRFCLDELVSIIDCIKAKGRLVLPVFYKVDPSEVRHQIGSYGEALAKYERVPCHEPKKVMKWRSVLCEAANLSGYHYDENSPQYEHEFIGKIVKEVSTKISRIPLHVADRPVGLESRVHEVNSLLDVGSDDGVKMVGIYGMGGSGKSTLARAIYNSIADRFDDLCFLSNVREKSIKQGLAQLQETLLFELTSERDIKFGDINKGIPVLKSRLNQKKILLVLDDIDKLEQLQALAGGADWFDSGSRIIITTRDRHLLSVHGIERGYDIKGLNQEEALELFNWKALGKRVADPDFQAMSERAVLCGHGLPLALEVMGSNLYDKTTNEWNSALDGYEENSDEQVQEVLKVSYNSLKHDEKEIFLDIACFFNGETLQYLENILLHYRGFLPEYAIGVLTEKSLIKIIKDSQSTKRVEIHDLIQDMGQNIVKHESLLEPGLRSRLWFYEDVIHVLEENKGTSKIQFLMLDVAKHKVRWSGKEFKKMTNLRVLIIKDVNFSQSPKYFPNSLRVLDWKGHPLSSLSSIIHPRKLIMLNLHYSFFTRDKALKRFEQLQIINFKGCETLMEILDLSEAPNLTELHLDFCKNLIRIHDPVGFHDKLRVISAKSCVNLKTFPRFLKMKSLEMLDIMGCSSLKYFSEILGNMENPAYISLRGTGIKELPCSIHNATALFCLDLSFCQRLKKVPTCILRLPTLKTLLVGTGLKFEFFDFREQVITNQTHIYIQGCDFLDEFLPVFLGCFNNLISLDLHGSNLTILPKQLQARYSLRVLNLDNCKQLREIRGIPPNIEKLTAINCTSLLSSVSDLLLADIHRRDNRMFILPGTRIPRWFDQFGNGASFSFQFRDKFPDFVIFFVGDPNQFIGSILLECRVTINGYEVGHWYLDHLELETQHTFLYNLHRQLELDNFALACGEDEWNHAEISHEFKVYELEGRKKPLVEQTGAYIKDRARIEKRDIIFTNPNPVPWNKRNFQDKNAACFPKTRVSFLV